MILLDIKGLHLEIVPFKKKNIEELYRLCFNCEVSIIVSYGTLKDIIEDVFISALDKQYESAIENIYDVDKTEFTLKVVSDMDEISIIIKIYSKIEPSKFNVYNYTFSKLDNKKINKFRNNIYRSIN